MATAWYGGPLQAKERRKKAVEHKWEIENTLFFGARSYTAGTNNPRHTAGGLIEYVTAETDATGTFDKGELQDFLREGLEFGSQRKVLFCAPLPAQVMSEFLQDNWVRARPEDSVFGVQVDAVISGVTGQKIPVVVKSEWKRYGEGTSGHYGSRSALVDMDYVQYAPLRDTVLKPNRQTPDADEQKAEFITEFSLKVERPEVHRWLINVTG